MPAKKKSSGKAKAKAHAKAQKAARKAAAAVSSMTEREKLDAVIQMLDTGYFLGPMQDYLSVPEHHLWLRMRRAELKAKLRLFKMTDSESLLPLMTDELYEGMTLEDRRKFVSTVDEHLITFGDKIVKTATELAGRVFSKEDMFDGVEDGDFEEYFRLTTRLVLMWLNLRLGKGDPDLLDSLMNRMTPPIIGASVLISEQERYLSNLFDSEMPGIDITDKYTLDRKKLGEIVKTIDATAWAYTVVRKLAFDRILKLWQKTYVSLKSETSAPAGDNEPWDLLMSVSVVTKEMHEMFLQFPNSSTPKKLHDELYSIISLECSYCMQSMTERAENWAGAVVRMYMRVVEGKATVTPEEFAVKMENITAFEIIAFAKRVQVEKIKPVSPLEEIQDPGIFLKCPGTNHNTWRLCESCYLSQEKDGTCGFKQFCKFKVSDFEVEYYLNEGTGMCKTPIKKVSNHIADVVSDQVRFDKSGMDVDEATLLELVEAMYDVRLRDDEGGEGTAASAAPEEKEAGMAFRER